VIAAKPVAVQRAAFIFCRTSVAVALWVAWAFGLPWLVVASAAVLAASAVLAVERAPMIVFYSQTLGRAWPGGTEVLDERAMRVAHGVGAALTAAAAAMIYVLPRAGYTCLFFVAVAKTAGALGFCSVLRLYGCVNSDTCCTLTGRKAR
jgi:hypothetical protein